VIALCFNTSIVAYSTFGMVKLSRTSLVLTLAGSFGASGTTARLTAGVGAGVGAGVVPLLEVDAFFAGAATLLAGTETTAVFGRFAGGFATVFCDGTRFTVTCADMIASLNRVNGIPSLLAQVTCRFFLLELGLQSTQRQPISAHKSISQ
jgi:hypothetical protein